jgi:programmed cell death protein 5
MRVAEELELEELKRRRMLQLRKQLMEQEKRARMEAQKQAALRVILTPEARQRLANIKLVRPTFAEQLELQLIQAAQSGRIKLPVSDEQLKEILARIQPRRERRIKRL